MDLLVIKEKVDGSIRKFENRYELYYDRDNSLFRKKMLLGLPFVSSVEIIEIEPGYILEKK